MNKIKQWLNWWIDETALTVRESKNRGMPICDMIKGLALWSYVAALCVFLIFWVGAGRYKAAYWSGMVIAGSGLIWIMVGFAIMLRPIERAWEQRKRQKENPAQGPGSGGG